LIFFTKVKQTKCFELKKRYILERSL